jgi:hypothetical protein
MNARTLIPGTKVVSLKGRGHGQVVSIDPETREVRVHFSEETADFKPHTCVFRRDELDAELQIDDLKFEDVGRGVQAAFVDKKVQGRSGTRTVTYAVRVAPERNGAGVQVYRIDKTASVGGAWLPWEAIDRIEYASPELAQAGIRAWATA